MDDQWQRNSGEGKIGQGKWRYGLDMIREELAVTQGLTIAINVLVIYLQKWLELLFSFLRIGSSVCSAMNQERGLGSRY